MSAFAEKWLGIPVCSVIVIRFTAPWMYLRYSVQAVKLSTLELAQILRVAQMAGRCILSDVVAYGCWFDETRWVHRGLIDMVKSCDSACKKAGKAQMIVGRPRTGIGAGSAHSCC